MLKEQHGFKNVVMVGDGATDLEAYPPAVSVHAVRLLIKTLRLGSRSVMCSLLHPQSAFIGFGGNVVRQQVKEKSLWYVTSFGELLKELENI